MLITEASLSDIPAICTLVNSAYRGDSSRRGWTTEADLLDGIRIDELMLQEYLQDKNSIILKCIDHDNHIIGCVYLKKQDQQLYLGMLTVSPNLQAQGTGKKLLKAAEEKAIESRCQSIVMSVITTRKELIDWYKRHGYVETGERQPFPKSERFGKPKEHLEFLVMQKML